MDMVERVARAMWEWSHYEPWSESRLSPFDREVCLDEARVAIEAMRSPSQPMRLAGYKAFTRKVAEHGDVDIIWQAMIDAALKAPSESTSTLPDPSSVREEWERNRP